MKINELHEMPVYPSLPEALGKACCDPFDYAVGLRDGTVLFVHVAQYTEGSEWIHFTLHEDPRVGRTHAGHKSALVAAMTFDRGIDVRLSEIAWCADAPYGS